MLFLLYAVFLLFHSLKSSVSHPDLESQPKSLRGRKWNDSTPKTTDVEFVNQY